MVSSSNHAFSAVSAVKHFFTASYAGLRAPRYKFCTGLLVCAAVATLAARGVPVGGKEPPLDSRAILSLSSLDHARDDPELAEGSKVERLAQDRPFDSPLILSLSKAERLAQDRPRHDPAIETLAIDAAGVAPEFAADAMIRIASSPRVTDPAWRRELLDEAYMRAYAAQEQYRRSSTQAIPPDSRQGAQYLAYATSLTRVSLQVRAAQLMALTDPSRARELFEWIDLNLAPGVCEDPLVPAVDEYYSALSLLARTTFGADRGEALRFLELYLWRAQLPSEMPAVARALERFRPRPDEAVYLEGLFRWILDAGVTDARGFSSSALDIVSRTADLQDAHRALGVGGAYLMEVLRPYLIGQLKAPRCSDSDAESLTPPMFNAALRRLKADEVKPIEADSVRPSRMLGIVRFDLYWQTPEARRLHDDALRLRGRDKAPLPLKVRQTREWREQAERLLTDVEQWTGRREATERDYFYQKSVLFVWLLDLMPRSAVRTKALHAFVELLRHADVDRDRRTLWFAFLNRLLEMARGGYRGEILDELEDSHHPVLSLYARLERVMPAGRRP